MNEEIKLTPEELAEVNHNVKAMEELAKEKVEVVPSTEPVNGVQST